MVEMVWLSVPDAQRRARTGKDSTHTGPATGRTQNSGGVSASRGGGTTRATVTV